jgi:hypothetical protein
MEGFSNVNLKEAQELVAKYDLGNFGGEEGDGIISLGNFGGEEGIIKEN